ncbi:MAG: hypothetical protein WBP93_15435 [Pyrinomonadaceae bacterium]
MTAQVASDGHTIKNMVAMGGELPSAATLEGKLFVPYITKSSERRSAWLMRV